MAYNEAKGEPGVGFDDGAGVVAAVVAPAHKALVAFHILAEGVLAASEDDAHGTVGDDKLGRRAVAASVVEMVGQCARERGVSCSTGAREVGGSEQVSGVGLKRENWACVIKATRQRRRFEATRSLPSSRTAAVP